MDFDHFTQPGTDVPLALCGDALEGNGERFAIIGGVPRFVGSDNYTEAFGLQWNTFKKTQFDSNTGTPITENRLTAAFGCGLSELKGLRVLEAGSGAGRFTEVLLKYGAVVYSFDFSSAVDANYQNNMPHEDLTVFQADIRRIPFSAGFFDAVVCLGVLQHTPSTRESLAELARVLRPGGRLVCDHYKYQLGMFTSLYLIWWLVIRRLKPASQLAATDALTHAFFPIHWTLRNVPLAQMLLRRISPINFYHGRYDLPKGTLYEWSRLDTHDRNTDYYKRHVTRRGFKAILRSQGLTHIEIFCGGTGYVGRATK